MPKYTPEPTQLVLPFTKLCECGCGQPAPISNRTHVRYGWVKGQPKRFIRGHSIYVQVWPSVEERFWRRVNKDGPIHPVLNTACWVWIKGFGHFGYGRIWDGNIMQGAHRYSYILHNGPISDELFVCHRCDYPPCVNPDHLFLGTQQDNIDDMVAKGRHYDDNHFVGESNPSVKLTAAQVIQIR